MQTTMFHAEMMVNKKIFNLGDFLSARGSQHGAAWRRAMVETDDDIDHVVCWPMGSEEPQWWSREKEVILLEKQVAKLRGQARKVDTKSKERKALEDQIVELEKAIEALKSRPKVPEAVVASAPLQFGQMVTCSACSTNQRYTKDNTSCYDCKASL